MELTDEQLQQLADMVAKKLADKGLEIREESLDIKSIDFDDTFNNGSGNDMLDGGSGNDTMISGGDDILTGISGNDTIISGGDDIINRNSDSFTLKSRDENQVLKALSKETNQSSKEILRKALALIKIALYSEKEGATLAIVKNGKILNEMVGFLNSAE